MHDLALVLSRHMVRGRRLTERNHSHDFPAKTAFVELERRLALAVEREVRIPLHDVFSRVNDSSALRRITNGDNLRIQQQSWPIADAQQAPRERSSSRNTRTPQFTKTPPAQLTH